MQRKVYNKKSDANLLVELMAATGRGPLEFDVSPGDDRTIIKWPDGIAASVIDGVVTAHSPAVYAQREQRREQNRARDLAALRQWENDPATSERQKALLRVVRRILGELVED